MDTECSICLTPLDKNDKSLITVNCCNHQFHVKCYLQWMSRKRTCPLCRNLYGNVVLPDTVIHVQLPDRELQRISRFRIVTISILICGFTGFYFYLRTNY